ncbi:MAG: Hsp20 family protein [Candidatus Bathyarchaeia archaeon]|jgi:HSP20 family molecular chaperone IbpA
MHVYGSAKNTAGAAQTFYRRIQLPEKVKSDDAKASLNNGILEIMLPKKEPKETKKLTIA